MRVWDDYFTSITGQFELYLKSHEISSPDYHLLLQRAGLHFHAMIQVEKSEGKNAFSLSPAFASGCLALSHYPPIFGLHPNDYCLILHGEICFPEMGSVDTPEPSHSWFQ